MSKRNCHPPHHESPHEQRLREIVDELVPDDSQKQAYVAFARELAISLRRGPKMGDSPSEQRVGLAAVQSPFSAGTKRVVMKWFARGLHGNILRRIGDAILRGS